MTIVGTLATNRKGLPADFKNKNRPEGDYLPLFQSDGGPMSIHSWICNKPGWFFLVFSSVSDPYSLNLDPDPVKNLNPDPDPERP